MAGANGPTSAGGTPDTPNPEGGATPKPDGKAAGDAEREDEAKEKASQDQNEDG